MKSELIRLHHACENVARFLEENATVSGDAVSELRDALSRIDGMGNPTIVPNGGDPKAIAEKAFSYYPELDPDVFNLMCDHGEITIEQAQWANDHLKLALINDQTMAALAVEK